MPLTLFFQQSSVVSTTTPLFQFRNVNAGFTIPQDDSFLFEPSGASGSNSSFDFKGLTFNLNLLQFTVDPAVIFDGQINLELQAPSPNNAVGSIVQPLFHMLGFASDTVTVQWNSSDLGLRQQPLNSGQTLTLTNYVIP